MMNDEVTLSILGQPDLVSRIVEAITRVVQLDNEQRGSVVAPSGLAIRAFQARLIAAPDTRPLSEPEGATDMDKETIKTLLEVADEQQETIIMLLDQNLAGRRIGEEWRSEILATLSRTKASLVRTRSRFKEEKSEQPTTN